VLKELQKFFLSPAAAGVGVVAILLVREVVVAPEVMSMHHYQ